MKLRPHQIKCISAIDSHIKKNENVALVKMFCGSGKSMIIPPITYNQYRKTL